jgi:hypothetical protein
MVPSIIVQCVCHPFHRFQKLGASDAQDFRPIIVQPSTATCMDGRAFKPPIGKPRSLDSLHDTTPGLGEE